MLGARDLWRLALFLIRPTIPVQGAFTRGKKVVFPGVVVCGYCAVEEVRCMGVAVCGSCNVWELRCVGVAIWGSCILPNLNSLHLGRLFRG